MSWRRILVLLVLVAALGAYLYLYEVPRAQREGKKDKLVVVDKDAITGLGLIYPDREIDLRKGDTGWRLTRPVDAPADEATVKSVVNAVADAEVQKTLDEVPQDLASFGLDKPTVTVRLTLKDGTQLPAIAVGKNTAIGGKTYVRKGDEPKLYLTTTALSFGLNKQAKDLRDKQILVFRDDDVRRVEIVTQAGDTTAIIRSEPEGKGKGDGAGEALPKETAWTIMPGGYTADPTEVRSYLSSLRATRPVDFPDDAPADLGKYGLDHPRLTVRVLSGTDDGEALTLLVGGETTQGSQKQIYAKRGDQPVVYALAEFSFNTLDKTAAQLRDKTVLPVDPSRVGKVVIECTGGGVTLVRAEGGWKIEGVDRKTKDDAIARFLDDLRDLRGSDIAAEPATNLAAYGLDAPDLRISVADRDGQTLGTILGGKRDAKRYVMRDGTATVFEARDYMYARLEKQARDFEAAPEGTAPAPGVTVPPAPSPPPGVDDMGDEDLDDDEE